MIVVNLLTLLIIKLYQIQDSSEKLCILFQNKRLKFNNKENITIQYQLQTEYYIFRKRIIK